MWWFKVTMQRIERRLAPWVEREHEAHRNAVGASHEASLVRSQRGVVARVVFELGLHDRNNHIVDMIQDVVKGAKSK